MLVNIMGQHHTSTKRDYSKRMSMDKWKWAEKAKKFDKDYWDGDRLIGYGGYADDGRWKKLARRFNAIYSLDQESIVLEIGCGKGYLLNEICLLGKNIVGVDVSKYALDAAPENVQYEAYLMPAHELRAACNKYDLIISINTLHCQELPQLIASLKQIQWAGKQAYICVESYRNEREKMNLLYWQNTCECFFTPDEWLCVFDLAGYTGDYEFIYFE